MTEQNIVRKQLIQSYQNMRKQTENLCLPLAIEDYVIQSIDDVSPPKWHLAHTTWFFETFILIPYLKNFSVFSPLFQYLFNSYYQNLGSPYPRIKRGVLARPTVETVYLYREYVDEHITELLEKCSTDILPTLISLLTLGINHEQQHQELLLMDIKHNLSMHLDFPAYHKSDKTYDSFESNPSTFLHIEGGIVQIGHDGKSFCFDNELPRHVHVLKPFLFAECLVTNEEYMEFIDAGGYQQPEYWLADGWDYVQKNYWQAPLYWFKTDNSWQLFTLEGLQDLNPKEPVVHVSFYEAAAYASFRGARLPTEHEWEHVALKKNVDSTTGNFLEKNILHPYCAMSDSDKNIPKQLFGDVWEWTASAYAPYPGFKSLSGVLAEYNGKFMSNQMVLRGGCCVTPALHIRASYRNFFQPDKRWQFSGIRLAKDA